MKGTKLTRKQIILMANLIRRALRKVEDESEEVRPDDPTELEQALHWLEEHGG